MQLLLVLGFGLVTVWADQRYIPDEPCEPSECIPTKCPTISKSECEKTPTGLFVEKGDRCGCCDVCLPFDTLEESCERSMTGEGSRTYTSPVHVSEETGTSCTPSLVYRGEENACERPRGKRELVDSGGQPLPALMIEEPTTEPDLEPEIMDIQVPKPRTIKRRIAPPRSFQVRWSACDEPECDRGVCPLGMSRKSMCGGRFFPDQKCPCCGKCSVLFSDDIDPHIGRDEDGGNLLQITRQMVNPDTLNCEPLSIHCYQFTQCERTQMHRVDAHKCQGYYESIDPTYCHCCGKCNTYLGLHEVCADVVEGNQVNKFPGCKEQYKCLKSPVDESYICWEPCPDEDNCGKYKCQDGQMRRTDCERAGGHFKVTTFCACCGSCIPFLKRGEACFLNGKPVEPGCGIELKCSNGLCVKDSNYTAPGKKAQNKMLAINPDSSWSLDFPQIDREGFFYPVQCRAYKCFCVSPDGHELGYVMPRFYAFNMLCDCAREKHYGKILLKCDHLGNYQDLDYAKIPRLERGTRNRSRKAHPKKH